MFIASRAQVCLYHVQKYLANEETMLNNYLGASNISSCLLFKAMVFYLLAELVPRKTGTSGEWVAVTSCNKDAAREDSYL